MSYGVSFVDSHCTVHGLAQSIKEVKLACSVYAS